MAALRESLGLDLVVTVNGSVGAICAECRDPICSRQFSRVVDSIVASMYAGQSRPSDSRYSYMLYAFGDIILYAPWCHLVSRHASGITAVVIG